jgi:PhoPQ-activated pathogenicity-related protein
VEDQIISYTLHQFEEDTTDYTWPLLFPMVKSAIRGMDAVQSFSKEKLDHSIKRFVVSGASKRGWTTWLTAASGDSRVEAIAPMVIDILNMPVNLAHQKNAYGSYSKEIHDYVKLGIVQGLTSSSGKDLVEMIDPYSYRKKLTMPKMLFMGTNDPYWVIDNVKNYLPGIPGMNLINYTPNAGHGLNDGKVAFPALSAFFGITMAHGKYPECTWKTEENGQRVKLSVKTSKKILVGAKLWYANSKDKDFRNDKFYSKNLNISHVSKIKTKVNLPSSGYLAFYVALTYKNPRGGTYIVCTRAFMTDTHHIL